MAAQSSELAAVEVAGDEVIEFAEASAELVAERAGVDLISYRLPPCPHVLKHPIGALLWCARALFGIASLILMLALIAAIPIVNFLALGYLLEVEARVARTGKLRNAFLLLDVAPRLGSIALGIYLWLLPLRFVRQLRDDAHWIEPNGTSDINLSVTAGILAIVIAVHLCLALARGGSLSCFFRPVKNARWLWKCRRQGDYWDIATAGINDFLHRLRLKHHFMLGLKGFAGAFLWLAIPSAMLAVATPSKPASFLIALIGAPLMMLALSWLPFLQTRFAMTGRWRTMFELKAVRRLFAFSPLMWLISLVITYVLALPLYLAKVYLPPQDAMWLVTIVFIASIYPAKVISGWAVYRAVRRQTWPWFGWRWMARALLVPLLGLYVLLLFFTPLISEHGRLVLFEHHALLLPVPFLIGR